MRTYLATIRGTNGIERNVSLLAVSAWQAVALIHARYRAECLFIETI